MIKLQGKKVFLSALERDDCRKIWQETEFDFENPPDYFIVGASVEKADELYSDIQSKQGKTQIKAWYISSKRRRRDADRRHRAAGHKLAGPRLHAWVWPYEN